MTNQKPKSIFRDGPIAASVWERAGRHGNYFEYTVSRSFKGKEGFSYSGSYRERDAEALKHCVDQAVAWIREQEGDDSPQVEEVGDGGVVAVQPE
jgi:hypothetical protein